MQIFLIKRCRILRLEEFLELETQDAETAFEQARNAKPPQELGEIIHEEVEIVGGFPSEAIPMDSERA